MGRLRPKKRTVLILAALLLLVGVIVIAWEVNDWPPVRLILKYGFPPTGGPTGNVKTIEGIEFVEFSPGYFRMGSTYFAEGGDLLGKICAPLGLSWGNQPEPSDEMPTRWVEARYRLWVARTEVTNSQYEKFEP